MLLLENFNFLSQTTCPRLLISEWSWNSHSFDRELRSHIWIVNRLEWAISLWVVIFVLNCSKISLSSHYFFLSALNIQYLLVLDESLSSMLELPFRLAISIFLPFYLRSHKGCLRNSDWRTGLSQIKIDLVLFWNIFRN